MILDLAQDYLNAVSVMPKEHPRQHTLTLLEEAIRRDIHFMDRHPTTLFQCMWNSCWWYDCPDALNFFVFDLDEQDSIHSPWTQPGPKLYRFIEEWQLEKERVQVGYRWLRSLTPGPQPLRSAQSQVWRAHRNIVHGIAFSPDGRWLASADGEGEILLWDLKTGLEVMRFKGPHRSAEGVAFSADGALGIGLA